MITGFEPRVPDEVSSALIYKKKPIKKCGITIKKFKNPDHRPNQSETLQRLSLNYWAAKYLIILSSKMVKINFRDFCLSNHLIDLFYKALQPLRRKISPEISYFMN